MKNKIKLISLIIFLNVSYGLYCQNIGKDIAKHESLSNSFFISPIASGFKVYGNSDISLNTGKINLSIPLIDKFSDQDFEYPVNICYNSSGFKPSVPESDVGINWSLIQGGVITREVRGIPDDTDFLIHSSSTGKKLTEKGFLHVKDSNLSFSLTEKIFNSPEEYAPKDCEFQIPLIAGTSIEPSSDIYRFNFGKYSGKFVLNFDGSVKSVSYSGGEVKVDISNYHIQSSSSGYAYNYSEIRIVTDDGYIYCFGGDYSAMEYVAYSWINVEGNGVFSIVGGNLSNRRNIITAFHLTKIIAPNGRVLSIEYDKSVSQTYHQYPGDLINQAMNTSKQALLKNYVLSSSTEGYGNTTYKSYSLNKIALIKSVSVEDKKIVFFHSSRTKTMHTSDMPNSFGGKVGAQLDSVTLYYNDQRIESANLEYDFEGRLFLKGISNSNEEGKYRFDYFTTGSTISPLTIQKDHWGFWNGNDINKSVIPKFDSDFAFPVLITSNDRQPGDKYNNATLLSSIKYPTGGKTYYSYEPHSYSRSSNRNSYGELNTPTGKQNAGGARINSISHIDNQGGKVEYQYLYTDKIPVTAEDNNKCSGILVYKPIYAIPEFGDYNDIILKKSTTGYSHSSYDSEHIQYNSVMEFQGLETKLNWKSDSLINMRIPPKYLEPNRKNKLVTKIFTGDLPQIWETKMFDYSTQADAAKISIVGKNRYGNIVTQTLNFVGPINNTYKGDPVNDPPYGYIVLLKNTEYTVTIECMGNSHGYITINYPGTGYDYKEVKEFHSMKRTTFTNKSTNDDVNESKFGYTSKGCYVQYEPSDFALSFYNTFAKKPSDVSFERGKILSEEFYNKNGDLVRDMRYSYGSNKYSQRENNYSIFVYTPPAYTLRTSLYSCVVKEYFYPYILDGTIIRDYFPEEVISNKKFEYNASGTYLIKETLITSKGDNFSKCYEYPQDYNTGIYKEMVDKNMKSFIVTATMLNGEVGGQTKYSYFKDDLNTNNLIVKQNEQKAFFINNNGNSENWKFENILTYDKYNELGRVSQYTTSDNVSTVYLWSYSGQYPIAEIKNATYDQIKTILGETLINRLSDAIVPSTADMQAINNLRKNTALKDVHITTYTYKPLVGIQTMTDPSGLTTTYEYDDFNRLKAIKDPEGKTIESYQYHYKN